jgi:hypothetical protein
MLDGLSRTFRAQSTFLARNRNNTLSGPQNTPPEVSCSGSTERPSRPPSPQRGPEGRGESQRRPGRGLRRRVDKRRRSRNYPSERPLHHQGRPSRSPSNSPGRIRTGKVSTLVQAISTGHAAPTGFATTPIKIAAAPFIAVVDFDDQAFARTLPIGATGTAAIYTDCGAMSRRTRKIILRQMSIMNYVLPF